MSLQPLHYTVPGTKIAAVTLRQIYTVTNERDTEEYIPKNTRIRYSLLMLPANSHKGITRLVPEAENNEFHIVREIINLTNETVQTTAMTSSSQFLKVDETHAKNWSTARFLWNYICENHRIIRWNDDCLYQFSTKENNQWKWDESTFDYCLPKYAMMDDTCTSKTLLSDLKTADTGFAPMYRKHLRKNTMAPMDF